ncbi:5-bromo-4-chloroindolyl phosphate hydrolysis protein [Paracoccus nototheniae]|uniref:hypothetical protein n=1 Tax=Paracoccus nototheniae TaxID=2489002 RepID=UPI0010398F11|nr:hypothetical protein [Paracoccus nototheniae]
MADRTAARPLTLGSGPAILAGLVALGDIVLIMGWVAQDLSALAVLACHLAGVAAFGGAARLICRDDPAFVAVRLVILVMFGPFGGPVLLILAPTTAASALDRPLRQPRPRQTAPRDAADAIYDQIRQGRRHPLPPGQAPGLLDRLSHGTLSQQQEAIAAISRSYHPDMRPALMAALASPVPALRVQAAAVFARLRGSYGEEAKALLARAGTAGAADPTQLRAVAGSGFVDTDTCARLLALAQRLDDDRAAIPPAQAPQPFRPALLQAPRLRRYACGGVG